LLLVVSWGLVAMVMGADASGVTWKV